MNPYYQDDLVTLHHGDCLDVLRELPDASVDAVVTDPPYGLGFMGKEWDGLPPGEPWARECLRVLKPGGHLLAFGGTRTWHRLACAVEDAGFEVRDSIAWMYGSGFPKSLDVSKAIDKARTEDRAPVDAVRAWLNARRLEAGFSHDAVNKHFGHASNGGGSSSAWMTNPTSRALPTWDQWRELKSLFGFGDEMDAEVWRLNGRKGKPGDNFEAREVLSERVSIVEGGNGGWSDMVASGRFKPGEKVIRETAPATDASRAWQGWGTALKPAFEPIVVARKPLAGTVAANVLAHGTGALNIDGCRVDSGADYHDLQVTQGGRKINGGNYNSGEGGPRSSTFTPAAGRWPANVILDESHEPVLRLRYNLPTEVERTIRESFGASTDHLPAVQDARDGAAEQGAAPEVLHPPVPSGLDVGEPDGREGAEVRQAPHPGDSSEDRSDEAGESSEGRAVLELEGRSLPESGLRLREVEHPASDRATAVRANGDAQRRVVHPGAPASGGPTGGAPAPAVRGRASHQRREVGQSAGEPRAPRVEQLAPDEARRGRRGDVQAATGERGAAGAPLEVLRRECPPGWWHYFEVVGHRREGQAAALDEQSGETVSKRSAGRNGADQAGATWGLNRSSDEDRGHDDQGGASRFFYVAKADASERVRVNGIAHPTVKPLALMRWLVRLVTPPGGTVLEPFAGSGTTVEACLLEGFRCVAIEREADYLPLIRQRIDRRLDPAAAIKRAGEDGGLFDLLEGEPA